MLVGTHIVFHVEDGGGLLEGREGLFFCSLKSFFGFEVWCLMYLMSVLPLVVFHVDGGGGLVEEGGRGEVDKGGGSL